MTKIKLPYVHEFVDRLGTVRRYVRVKGRHKARLHGLPGSREFMETYQAAIEGPDVPVRRHAAGTLADLITRYYASVEFSNLSESSKETYRYVLEKHALADGHRLASDLSKDKARKIIEEIGAAKPGMANLTRSIFVALFEYAISIDVRPDNPFKRIKPYKLGTRHTWSNEELKAYRDRWPLGTRERLAFAVLLYSGQRVSDAVKLKRADVLSIRQKKTGAELSIPAHPALVRAVKAGPSNGVYIIGDENGRPIGPESLTKLIRRAVQQAGLPDHCKAHGLRKAAQRLLADAGATVKQMQAVSGHKTLRETQRYSDAANQALLASAAMALMPDEE